jgi:hypothetical protein
VLRMDIGREAIYSYFIEYYEGMWDVVAVMLRETDRPHAVNDGGSPQSLSSSLNPFSLSTSPGISSSCKIIMYELFLARIGV